jgi:hypothetical protein
MYFIIYPLCPHLLVTTDLPVSRLYNKFMDVRSLPPDPHRPAAKLVLQLAFSFSNAPSVLTALFIFSKRYSSRISMALVVLPNGMIREAMVGLSRGPISFKRSSSSSIDLMSVSAVEMRLVLYSIVVAAENTASDRVLGA